MAEKKAAMKSTKKSVKSSARNSSGALTAEEKAAMRETVKERKAAARGANDEEALLAKIAEMSGSDRVIAKRLHELIKSSAPSLLPKTWYGMPAYANKDGNVVCFFTPADKFKSRYATFGFNDRARLDEGAMWPTSFALTKLTAAEEARISALVKKAVR
jgi:uncharacterized protein YdhG (YjbR/CyaY superfamily)